MTRFIVLTFFLSLIPAFAENWPQFRGPNNAGIAANPDKIPSEWSESRNLRWKADLPGKGSSSPIIWGDRIFLTSYSGYGESEQNPGDQANLKRHLICLDKASGRILWTKTHQATHGVQGYDGFLLHHGYASHTPVTDGKAVYVFYAKEGALAYDFTGNQLWHFTGVGRSTGGFGSGGALTLFEDLLIVNASSESKEFIGLKKASGEEVWRTGGIVQCYNTPVILGDVVLATSRDQTLGLDARTGAEKWKGHGPPAYVCNTPAVVDDVAYLTLGYPGPTMALGPDGREIWRKDRIATTVSSPAVTNGLVYVAKDDILICLDAKSGDIVFRERMGVTVTKSIYASPLVVGDRIFIVTRRDGTLVFAAKRELELLAHNRIAGDDSLWNASPAVSDGRLYLRSEKALYCIGN